MSRRWLLLTLFISLAARPANADDALFENQVRPVLVNVCFRCHGGERVAGALRVDSRAGLLKGGDSGPAIDPGQPHLSLLLQAIRREDGVAAMPPDKPLRPEQIQAFADWLQAGAPWPQASAPFRSARHWSFEPVRKAEPPQPKDRAWAKTPIDAFIRAKQEAEGASPAPPADRRTLIRRASYDLTGLPPTPEEAAAFEQDPAPPDQAFQTVVERLLKSPRYGEKWGRLWLDVVRYADTAGENTDHPLPHAWRYRNWVIDAWNADKPYDQFLREQIAGDLLAQQGPSSPQRFADLTTATGYLAIARRFGHDIDKDMHLTYEDVIDTLGKSVLGLTLGCCRCHDHKYDPLTNRDYYGLYGIFESTKFAFPGCEPKQQPRDLPPLVSEAEAKRLIEPFEAESAKLDALIRALDDQRTRQAQVLKESIGRSVRLLSEGAIDDGKSADFASEDRAKTALASVAIRRGEVLQLAVSPRGNHGADTTLIDWEIAEIGGQGRRWSTKDLVSDLLAGNPRADAYGHPAVWCFLSLSAAGAGGPTFLPERLGEIAGKAELQAWRDGDTPSIFVNSSDHPVAVWTAIPPRSLLMHPGPSRPVALAWVSPIDGAVSLRGRIADAHPSGPDGVGWRLEHFATPELGAALAELGAAREPLAEAKRKRDEHLKNRPDLPVAYAVQEGSPKNARIHQRGEPANLGQEVPRKFLDVLGGGALRDPSRSGRLELAEWLTAPANPLTARVIVNRVWQGHFGQGLVKTPNDFGSRGAPPTHPELLDALASEFMASGWSIKALHRLIMSSAVYQQAAASPPALNRDLYAGLARRRLSAEELRDAILFASGELDLEPGRSHPFPPQAGWSFTQHAPFAAEYPMRKRSVYLMQKRNRRDRFLALFDGPDPNASTPVRDLTTVPTQALFFLNDPFFHEQARALAIRVLKGRPDEASRLDFAFRLLLSRSPSAGEADEAAAFLKTYANALTDPSLNPEAKTEQAWSALARVLLGGNEALYVE